MAREGSKRQIAIEVMTANADKPMVDVLPLIMEQCDLKDLGAARGYYKHIAEQGWAPGTVPATTRGRKPKAETQEQATETPAAAPVEEPAKTEEEIDAIRAANLAKIAEIKAKKSKKPKKTEDVAVETDENDHPEKLSAEQVASLV